MRRIIPPMMGKKEVSVTRTDTGVEVPAITTDADIARISTKIRPWVARQMRAVVRLLFSRGGDIPAPTWWGAAGDS